MARSRKLRPDVLIVGSGPAGCTFARILAEEGRDVLVVEAGAQHSRRPGEHLKNAAVYQKNIDSFTPVVQGLLQPVSIPEEVVADRCHLADPYSFRSVGRGSFRRQAHNPRQKRAGNLPGAAVSYGVGGMFTHWTNNTPRHCEFVERWSGITDEEWDLLYGYAEQLLDVHTDVFDRSARQRALQEAINGRYGTDMAEPLPVAGHRRPDNEDFVCYAGCDTILGPLVVDEPGSDRFEILEQHLVRELRHDGPRVHAANVRNLLEGKTFDIEADEFIICGGALLTPQLLHASEIRPPALGHYLTEHPLAFCQIVLSKERVAQVAAEAEKMGMSIDESDAIKIPVNDPQPMLCIRFSAERQWHCQIHRDSFAYGAVPDEIDDRLIVDLRWFGRTDSNEDNYVAFEDDYSDVFGMPQPTFHFTLSEDDRIRARDMMDDMLVCARALGGFLPGSEPKFMPAGAALHFMGGHRMGLEDDGESVTDDYSRVWGFENLRLGGNGQIPTSTASNPSLTSVAIAVRSAYQLADRDVPPAQRVAAPA